MSLRLLAAAAWMLLALLPLRAEPVSVGFEAARIDLLPFVEVAQDLEREVTVELPAADGGSSRTLTLNGRGPGPIYRWAVVTLHNPDAAVRELVIAAPHQRFVASRILWPLPEGSRVISLETAEGQAVPPLPNLGADAFALTLPPGATGTYVLEVSATGLDSLSLWHRGAFHVVSDRYSFFRGLVLGISILLGIGFICLFIVRPRAVFPAAALFGWSAIGFLVIETGYLPVVLAKFPALAGSEHSVRAVVEGLMLAGVVAMLVSFLELRRWMPRIAVALMAGGAAAAALALYGVFEPRVALGIIRIAFAAAVAIGLVLMLVLWRRGAVRAQASLLGWTVLTGWTVAAGFGALALVDPALMHPLISAGLVLVLVTIGFTLAQLAFGLGIASSEAFEEAGRRALALAASDQAVWDWQVDQGRLHVGPEIERALGVEEGTCCDAAAWLDLIHPADRGAYGAAVEAAERRGRGSFSQEFRLRRADGSYRWYVVRGRAIPGGSDGASRLIGTLADVTVLRRSEDRLLADAVRDRLTGLPNRALFLDRLEQAMRRARDIANPGLYVIALDLDRFKSFNDGLGAEAGDYLLTTVGQRLQTCVGPADTIARLPGHQFAIIWHANPLGPGITELTQEIGSAVAQPIYLPAGEVVLTASMGVAHVHPAYRRADEVLKDAEIALHEAKRHGYAAVDYFRPDMHDERSELMRLEQNLRHALERDEIEVVYQPIVRLADRKLAGFEALMRWRRGGVLLEPDSFVRLAEETGIIGELGRFVLKEACGRLGVWQRTFRPQDPLFVAVNISSVQLLNGDLVEDIQHLLERDDLQPGTLKLELTESLVVQNPELAHKLLMRLKRLGVALACDDFGTGYSGLESVFRLPFDSVKIDRVFLEGDSADRNWVMVEAMLRLARDLRLAVVAEGVETEDQMERLSALGCDYGQGYLIGPPVAAQQVVEALGGHTRGAGGLAGLSEFWSGLTRRKADATTPAAPPRGQPGRAPDEAPEPQDGDTDPVIDVRAIMPGPGKSSAPGKPSAPAVPEVGTAPFAPRRIKPSKPEGRLFPSVELPVEQPGPQSNVEPAESEPAPVATEEIPMPVPEPAMAPPPACEPAARNAPEAKPEQRDKPRAPQPAGGNGSRRKPRRGAKAAPGKADAARTDAGKTDAGKTDAGKTDGGKTDAVKTGSGKRSPSRRGAAKRKPAKRSPAKRSPARQQ